MDWMRIIISGINRVVTGKAQIRELHIQIVRHYNKTEYWTSNYKLQIEAQYEPVLYNFEGGIFM